MSIHTGEQQVEPDVGVERPAGAPGPLPLPLQTPAGNAAVGRLLRRRPDVRSMAGVDPAAVGNRGVARLLARYEAFEHAKQGNEAKGSMTITLPVRSGGLQANISLTSGEINALADLYASPEDLEKADAVELAKLQALIKRQLAGEKVPESAWDDATGGRYNRLNLRNAAHFGARNTALIDPGSVPTGWQDNRSRFLYYYNQTIVNGQSAFNQLGLFSEEYKQKWLDRAVISAGFAEHFLMDAFSAGHLFNKDDFIAVLKANLDALSKKDRDKLFQDVAKGVLADSTSKALLGGYEVTDKNVPWYIGGGWTGHPNLDWEDVFTGLLQHLYDDPEGRQAVYSALVKVVHDALSTNDAGGGLVGVEVENDYDKWILSGDKTLATSPKTQAMINRAIEEFRRQMEPYRKGTVTGGDPSSDAKKVLTYFPRPTAATAAFISGKVKSATDAKTGSVTALIDILKKELPSTLSALVDRGEIRKA